MNTVTIVQRILPHYRIPFVLRLRSSLEDHGIALRYIYGQEYPGTVPKTIPLDEPWAIRIENRYIRTPGKQIVWQPCRNLLKDSDLVVIEQANRLLLNYLLLSKVVARNARVAFWGHGCDFQSTQFFGLRKCWKRALINQVDWWFAYTTMTAEILRESGFPENRISVLNNAIDTGSLASACEGADPSSLARVKAKLGIESDHVGVYCGGMYQDKCLPFLLESSIRIRELLPDFHVTFIGDGPLQHLVEEACSRNPWMHYVGPRFGDDRVPYFKMAKALLMPGPVGLAIVDSFLAGVPLFTTNIPIHGPEIAYLQNGINGVMTDHDVEAYARAVSDFLRSPERQENLRKGCAESAKVYTLDNMVGNFAKGVVACLKETVGSR